MIEFYSAENMYWDLTHEETRLRVLKDGNSILCRISRETIEEHYDSPQSAEACLDAAKRHFEEITDEFGHLIAAGRFEEDSSVLLRSSDWQVSG